jgi:hypothetical protein
MNKTRQLADGSWVMEVDVDGKTEERACHYEQRDDMALPILIPELRDGEHGYLMLSGAYEMFTSWRNRE